MRQTAVMPCGCIIESGDRCPHGYSFTISLYPSPGVTLVKSGGLCGCRKGAADPECSRHGRGGKA